MNEKKEDKIERCGFCGSYFRGNAYLTAKQLNILPTTMLEKAPLGYCPNAINEQ